MRQRKALQRPLYGFLAVLKLGQHLGYDSDVGDAAKRIFLILQGHADKDGIAFPSVKRIADRLGLSRTAVTNQIKNLEEAGYLIRKTHYCSHSGRRMPNVISLNLALINAPKNTDALSARDATFIVIYLVTLLRYGRVKPSHVKRYLTLKGCINKPLKQISINKASEQQDFAIKKGRVSEAAWYLEKKREAETGITKEMQNEHEALYRKLQSYLGFGQITQFNTELTKITKEMELIDAFRFEVEKIKEKLIELSFLV